jgi:hypothetical protein
MVPILKALIMSSKRVTAIRAYPLGEYDRIEPSPCLFIIDLLILDIRIASHLSASK